MAMNSYKKIIFDMILNNLGIWYYEKNLDSIICNLNNGSKNKIVIRQNNLRMAKEFI